MASTVPCILAGVSVLGMVFKQYLNLLQLVTACKWLAEGDLEVRRKAGLPRRMKKNTT